VEITEAAGSEFLPGVGHDEGNATVDTVNGLYLTHGNLTVDGNSAYRTFVYDLTTGRGARMMPVPESPFGSSVSTAFDPDHQIALASSGFTSAYDRAANTWTAMGGPSSRPSPALTYDSRNRVFILFGGGHFDETWTLDPVSRHWTRRNPPVSPPPRLAANFAFDPVHGVALLVGGEDQETATEYRDTWVYDAALDQWTDLGIAAPRGHEPGGGELSDLRLRPPGLPAQARHGPQSRLRLPLRPGRVRADASPARPAPGVGVHRLAGPERGVGRREAPGPAGAFGGPGRLRDPLVARRPHRRRHRVDDRDHLPHRPAPAHLGRASAARAG
jgi:hypothetical protein